MQKLTDEEAKKELEELAAKMRPLIKKIEDDPCRLASVKRACETMKKAKWLDPRFPKPKFFYY